METLLQTDEPPKVTELSVVEEEGLSQASIQPCLIWCQLSLMTAEAAGGSDRERAGSMGVRIANRGPGRVILLKRRPRV